jgi:acyl-CoA synthetase
MWSEVDVEIEQLARSLYRAGVRQGDVVGVQLPNIVELAIAYVAVVSLGAIACPFPVQYAQHELIQMGNLAGLTVFLTVARANEARLAEQAVGLLGRVTNLSRVLAWGRGLPEQATALEDDLPLAHDDADFRMYRDGL